MRKLSYASSGIREDKVRRSEVGWALCSEDIPRYDSWINIGVQLYVHFGKCTSQLKCLKEGEEEEERRRRRGEEEEKRRTRGGDKRTDYYRCGGRQCSEGKSRSASAERAEPRQVHPRTEPLRQREEGGERRLTGGAAVGHQVPLLAAKAP